MHVYRRHFAGNRRERMFLSSLSFFATFASTRAITHAIRHDLGPFRNIHTHGGTHLHHAVFGIAGLLGIGYLWNAQFGAGAGSATGSRLTSLGFGSASALTLDEFALWLNLEDVYWAPKGRESIDAVVLFGSLLSLAAWGGGFWREASAEAARLRRRKRER